MANLGDTYLASLNDPIRYCTLDNDCRTHFHNSIEDAETYKSKYNLETLIWIDGEDCPNQEFIAKYNSKQVKLNPPFPTFMATETYSRGGHYVNGGMYKRNNY
jgi:hypothetical protein